MMTTRIGLTGDVMLGRLVDERQHRRRPEAVWGSMAESLQSCDMVLINLECAISNRGERWDQTPRAFYFRASPDWAIPALKQIGVDACALANNHILDFGETALGDTIDVLDEANIARSGAGRSLDEALNPAIVSREDCTVGVVSLTDNSPEYAATADKPGTAHIQIDVDNERTRSMVWDAMERARKASPDMLIASLHWGPNMVERPPAAFEAFARWLIDLGFDVVHGHSAHVFQGIEVYEGKPILYDTGDFVDDYAVDERLRNDRSFLFQLTIEGGDPTRLRLLPTNIDDCAVHQASPEAAEWSRRRIKRLSAPFGTSFKRDGEDLVVPLKQ